MLKTSGFKHFSLAHFVQKKGHGKKKRAKILRFWRFDFTVLGVRFHGLKPQAAQKGRAREPNQAPHRTTRALARRSTDKARDTQGPAEDGTEPGGTGKGARGQGSTERGARARRAQEKGARARTHVKGSTGQGEHRKEGTGPRGTGKGARGQGSTGKRGTGQGSTGKRGTGKDTREREHGAGKAQGPHKSLQRAPLQRTAEDTSRNAREWTTSQSLSAKMAKA